MFGGCVPYLRLRDMDLLCMFRSYVIPPIAIIHGSTVYYCYPWHGHHHRSIVYWSANMIGLHKFIYWSCMSLSLFASVSDEKLANYFTYHFLLASYFGGNFVAPRNLTFLISSHENFTLSFNLPEILAWVTLVIFFPYLEGTTPLWFLHRALVALVIVDPEAPFPYLFEKNPRSVPLSFLLGALMVKKWEKRSF